MNIDCNVSALVVCCIKSGKLCLHGSSPGTKMRLVRAVGVVDSPHGSELP